MEIQGRIVDEQENPVPGANVEILVGETRLARLTSDDDGSFEFSTRGPFPGEAVTLAVTREGYRSRQTTKAADADDLGPWTVTLKKSPPTPLTFKWPLITAGTVLAGLIVWFAWFRPNGKPPVAQPPPEKIYVVDSRQSPGAIVEVRSTQPFDGRTVWQYSAGPIAAVALFRPDIEPLFNIYFVPANSRQILKVHVASASVQNVYEHTTYIRDIAFNARGELFFSEASGAGANGFIYSLGNPETARRASSLTPRPGRIPVRLNEVGGYWAGDFAFNPSNTLFVSGGNRVPSAIYERVDSRFQQRYALNEPITGFAFTSTNRLLFTNHKQTLYALEEFSRISTVFSNPRAEWLNDVAVTIER